MKKRAIVLAALACVLFSIPPAAGGAQSSSGGATAQQPATPGAPAAPAAAATAGAAPQPARGKVTAYALPPDTYRKAHRLGQIAFWGQLVVFFYSLVILLLVLKWRLAPRYRTWAEKATSLRFLQAAIFAPLFLGSLAVLEIPADIAQHWVMRRFGLSIQGWASWSWDWTKGQCIALLLGIILVWILYAAIGRSARRWWFYFWVASLPILVFVVFLQPLVVDPLFHKFAPLAQKDPELTVSLERMVQRAGENIPPERMFWMGAGEKSTAVDAYVTGIGTSKRMVVWDTTIAKMTTPQIVYVAGHETGHYVLYHIPKGLAYYAAVFLLLFYAGHRCIGWMLARWGAGWKIHGVSDWASLPALLFLLTILAFLANPATSAFSRYVEHQADQYGLEVTHGLTPDAGQVAAQAFQILGEVNLADPDPNRVDVFLFYSHPPVPDRVRFVLTYDPWAQGGRGEFVK
jgi:Zn-dependent protease with chaperone function